MAAARAKAPGVFDHKVIEGASRSHLANCERYPRLHIGPAIGTRKLDKVTRHDVEALAEKLLAAGRSTKSVRGTLVYLTGALEYAIDLEWTQVNPVRRATKPKRRRAGDANPDLQFLTLEELEAVLRTSPEDVVVREPKPFREGRRGPSPPPPDDHLGPVLRMVVLTAAMTGLRQGELLGLRWRDVDWTAQRVRVRQTWGRVESSSTGKSDLSTRRSVPMADRLVAELDAWSKRSRFTSDDNLVFAHPVLGVPLDGSKVSKRFKEACADRPSSAAAHGGLTLLRSTAGAVPAAARPRPFRRRPGRRAQEHRLRWRSGRGRRRVPLRLRRRAWLAEHPLLDRTNRLARTHWVPDALWPLLDAHKRHAPRAAVLVDLLESDDPRAPRRGPGAGRMTRIEIDVDDPHTLELWSALGDLAGRLPGEWVLVTPTSTSSARRDRKERSTPSTMRCRLRALSSSALTPTGSRTATDVGR